MNYRRPFVVVTAALVGGMALYAASASAQDAEAPPAARYRESIMEGLDSHSGALRVLIAGGVTHESHVLPHAESIQALAAMLGEIFPEGSGDGTRALPGIWEEPAVFASKVSDFQSAAANLVASARAGNSASLGDAAQALTQSCRSCHGDFRARAGG